MDASISSIGATTIAPSAAQQKEQTPPDSNLDTFFDKAVEKLKKYEIGLQSKIEAAGDPSSPLMRMPDYMVQEFKRLEDAARTDEERALVERFKRGSIETFEANREHYANQITSKLDTFQMKIGAQFVSNTVKGVQQLLSAT